MDARRHQPRIDLGGRWSFAIDEASRISGLHSIDAVRGSGLAIMPATVPGALELDLLANGVIEDPFMGMNIVGARRYETATGYWFRTFDAPGRTDAVPCLVFEGIDCFADIFLNGKLIHQSSNMLTEQHVLVGDYLLAGQQNELLVVIRPSLDAARSTRHPYPPGLYAEQAEYEALYVRKAPHMFGWDIMPRALSAGLWRPVSLRFLPPERLDWVWLDTRSVDGGRALLAFHFRALTRGDRTGSYELELLGTCGTSTFSDRRPLLFDAGRTLIEVSEPLLWWPRGRGNPNLYDVTATLLRNGEEIDRLEFRHGIRTVELERTSVTDADGTGAFCFRVNGERTFAMGTNWVPVDAYHARDRVRIPAIVDMLDDLGCNMIRCWGGNVYEDDLLYDLCDQKGILVWQDFAMACAIYPQDREFQQVIDAEARQVVRRLRQHASLIVWAGDNECDQSYAWAGPRRDPNLNVLTRQVLPAVLRDEDPSRPYLPSSPWFDPVAFKVGERFVTEDHLWGPRGYFKSEFYTSAVCHFVSEIGYHGCPSPESLARFLTPGKLWPYHDNEEWQLHSTAPLPGVRMHDYRVQLMERQVVALFGTVPDTVTDFAFASQATQAEALKFFIELFRMGKWRRTGILWWNLIDGWPQLSDAIVDYYFVRKRAYDVVKRCQAPIHVMLSEPERDRHRVLVSNDTRLDEGIDYCVRDVDTHQVIASGNAVAGADAVTLLARIEGLEGSQRCLSIDWSTSAGPGWSHYLAGTPPFGLDRYRTWVERAESLARRPVAPT